MQRVRIEKMNYPLSLRPLPSAAVVAAAELDAPACCYKLCYSKSWSHVRNNDKYLSLGLGLCLEVYFEDRQQVSRLSAVSFLLSRIVGIDTKSFTDALHGD